MEKIKIEGIVLHAIPFQNYDCILTLFTPTEGLIKLFYKGGYRQKNGKGLGTTVPLAVIEVICSKSRTDFYRCYDISVMNANLQLRNNLVVLETACKIIQTLSATQLPGKSSTDLYLLLTLYLNKLAFVPYPESLLFSFKLKLMRYEGLFSLLSQCSFCSILLDDIYMHQNEVFCPLHTPSKDLFFTNKEKSFIEHLTFCRDLNLLAETKLPPYLPKKIDILFNTGFNLLA